MPEITETVTVTRPVDRRIGDLVRFAQTLPGVTLSQDELVERAKAFWDQQHGED